MLIIHGTVHTMDGPAIDNGFVAIREGKVTVRCSVAGSLKR